jgi:hypothetical protein
MKMKYYINTQTNEIYKMTDVCQKLMHTHSYLGMILNFEPTTFLPENLLELRPKIKRCYRLLFLTSNPIKNIRLFFNDDLNIQIQSKAWVYICKTLKFKTVF